MKSKPLPIGATYGDWVVLAQAEAAATSRRPRVLRAEAQSLADAGDLTEEEEHGE